MSDAKDLRPDLAPKDVQVHRASHYPAGTMKADFRRPQEDRLNLDGSYQPSVIAQALTVPVVFRRGNAETKPVTPAMSRVGPAPGRPTPTSSSEDIKTWNAFMATLTHEERMIYMGLRSVWSV